MMQNKGAKPLVCIVLVNYNGWQDTLECVSSLFRLNYPHFFITIVDNNSTDNSEENIINWAACQEPGNSEFNFAPDKEQATFNSIAFRHFTDNQVNSAENFSVTEKEVVLISSKINLGFAGGNNLGTKFAFKAAALSYVWYLNNDTVADPNALAALVNYFDQDNSAGSRLGILGSKLRYYGQPQVIQAIGGYYNKWFAYTKHVGTNELDQGQYDAGRPLPRIDYVVGASMLVSLEFIREVGFMNEAYFLYFEEIDWITRGKALGFTFAYCADSLVYHKEGQSTGGNRDNENKSYLADFYGVRNRIKFTRKFYPGYLFTVYLSLAGGILNRIKRKQYDRVGMILKIVFKSLRSIK